MASAPTANLSRRDLVTCLFAAGGLGSLGLSTVPAVAETSTATVGQVLASTLMLELLAVFAYQRVLDSSKLRPEAERVARELIGHEQEHVGVLTDELIRLGVAPPAPPASVAAADAELSARHGSGSLAELGSERDCLRLLLQVEAVAEGAYYLAVSKISDRTLLRTAVEIMAVEAQHATVISGLLHPGDIDKAVPYAFVEGEH